MSAKQFINSPDACAVDGLSGLRAFFPALRVLPAQGIVFDTIREQRRKVAILSGGGSGHEPFSSGYVGQGMLAASVSGPVFASPPSGLILDALRKLCEENDGVLVAVLNYTGDVLNFGLAAEKAVREGLRVDTITVGEDIAGKVFGTESKAGARGTCGVILVLKIAGYLSERGDNLEVVKSIAQSVANNLASLAVGLESCTLPGAPAGPPTLGPKEMDVGIGMHGESGSRKMEFKPANETVTLILNHLIKHLNLNIGDEVVAMVNNLGALSNIELWIIASEVQTQLNWKRIKVLRMYVGDLFTSINTPGVQICLFKVPNASKSLLLTALDAPTAAAAWPGSALSVATGASVEMVIASTEPTALAGNALKDHEAALLERCLKAVARALSKNAAQINHLDKVYGDGDCGTTLNRLASDVLQRLSDGSLDTTHPAEFFRKLGTIAETTMGGTSGAIYGLFLVGASTAFTGSVAVSHVSTWIKAWTAGIESIKKYSVARVGDRTLMDALEPSLEAFRSDLDIHGINSAIVSAATAAREGCCKTKFMTAKVGRASYVKHPEEMCVDAGAFGVMVIMEAISDEFSPTAVVASSRI